MHGIHLVAVEWAFVVFAFLLICLRFFLRYGRRGRLIISDYLVVIAWLFFVAITALDTALYRLGLFEGTIQAEATKWGPGTGLATKAQTILAMKLIFAETTIYYCTLFATKGALIAFYYELIPKDLIRLRQALHGITIFTIVGWIISVSLKIFIKPPSFNWAIGGAQYRASYGLEPNAAGWVWHIITNIMIFVLPLVFVRKFKVPLRETLFCAGFISFYGFVSIALAITAQISRTAPQSMGENMKVHPNFAMSWLYFALDQTFAILVVCCPVFKALLCRESWSAMRAKMSAGGSTVAGWRSEESSVRSGTPNSLSEKPLAPLPVIGGYNGWGSYR